MMSLAVTGASGFIGSALSRFFSAKGYSVFGTTRFHPDLPDISVGAVIHCASQQPRKNLTLEDYLDGNVRSLEHVLAWMKQRHIKRIITFSSVTVYGHGLQTPLDENTSPAPDNHYSRTKWRADQLLENASREDQLTGICFRMPSVFGPGQGGGLVDTYFESAQKGDDIEVYSEGKLKRNLLYVDEVLQICEKAISKFTELKGFNSYLIGSSNSLTMAEIAEYIKKKINSKSQISLVKQEAPVNSHWILRLGKAQKELGFIPKSIEEGIDRYCAMRKAIS